MKNTSKTFLCPFYTWDEKTKVHCEGGRMSFKDRESAKEYIDRYCAGDWRRCTVAAALLRYYERTEK